MLSMITVQTILRLIEKQRTQIYNLHDLILRSSLEQIQGTVKGFARIITGIRRSGKSTFVQMIAGQSKSNLYLNFDEPELAGFSQSDFQIFDLALKEYERKYSTEIKEIFLDEIQNVSGWELYVCSKLKESVLITITGSNASLLSSELGTKLTGRHLDFEIFPFDFCDFVTYTKKERKSVSFEDYLIRGGFPEYLIYKNDNILRSLFDDIIIRDVVVRYGIRDIKSVRMLAAYLISNCGNLISGTKLSTQLQLKTTVTILEYLSFFEQSYLFFFVPKFDPSLKVQSVNPKKVYCIDTGMILKISSSIGNNLGAIFENAVFLIIRRKTKNIWYYAEKGFECDFLFGSTSVPSCAVQACYEINQENMERETAGLVETMKKFRGINGYIVTLKQNDIIRYNGYEVNVISVENFISVNF